MNKIINVIYCMFFVLLAGMHPLYAQQKSASGLVVDENDQPLIGVQVKIDGTTMGTVTDIEGNFTINVKSGDVLLFSYVGYEPQKVNYKGEKILAIKMLPSTEMLEDVVVIGYGKQKKNSLVSSINAIGPKELAMSPSRNLTNNLAGQVAGLIAVQRTGQPGYDDAEFWIRGQSSFKGGTTPLVLVDGVPRKMNDIETDEIESFTLLKDAAATAVYGAEGANGVILITSKRGTSQKPRISFRAEGTMNTPTRLPKFMNAAETLTLYNEAVNNEGSPSVFSAEEIAKYASGEDPDLYPDTDWQDIMLRDHTYNMRYTLNVRGGSERARYFVSGAFFQENGIFKDLANDYDNNIGLKRYNLRSNIDFDATKSTVVKIDLSGQYIQLNRPGADSVDQIFEIMCRTPAFLMPPVYSDGTLALGHDNLTNERSNPYNMLVNYGYSKEWRTAFQSKVEVDQELAFITKGLSWKGLVSFDSNMLFTADRRKKPSQYRATGRDEAGNLMFEQIYEGSDALSDGHTNTADKKIYIETSFNYNRTFAEKHDVTGMLLYMQKETQYHDNSLAFRKQGLVGRATYGYDGRYFIEGNFGYTGSETFAKGHRFGFFPAVGLAWYVSNEPYYPQVLAKVMNKLKFRVSVGRTGNDDTGGARFLYRGTLNQGNSGYDLGFSNTGTLGGVGSGITEAKFEAPYLSWEIEDKRNYGIDLGFFDNRIDLQVDYFNNKRHAILLQRSSVPGVVGFFENPWQNYGVVKNHGVDASLNLNHRIGEVKLSARGNFTFARNEIIEYDQVPQRYPWMEKNGTRLNSWNLYIADGLYTYDDFIITGEGLNRQYELKPGVIPGVSQNVRPGDIKYKDLNGDGRIDGNDMMQDVGHPSVPEIVYGFGFNAEWRGFYAGVFFQGAGNTSTLLGASADAGGKDGTFFPFGWGLYESTVRAEVANRWTEDNPSQNVMFPRLHRDGPSNQNNTAPSTWWQRDGSFLRLKNVEFGYNFSEKMLSKIGIHSLRLYIQGNNLCVWDDIKMWDPEQGVKNGGFAYPLNRSFTFGLDFSF